jgi:prepilin-type N-terminal cleavage/methylation domain-containing protein
MRKRTFYSYLGPSKAGFTLLELLTAIAIISILAVLVVKGVKSLHETAEGTRCVAKLRSISQASLHYAADHDQTLPSLQTAAAGIYDGIWFRYRDLVVPYLDLSETEKERLFTCASDTEFSKLTLPSYVFSGGNEYKPGLLKGVAGTRLPSITVPGRTLLLLEGSMLFFKSFHDAESTRSADFRAYASFVDGHAGSIVVWRAPGVSINAGINPPDNYGYTFGD